MLECKHPHWEACSTHRESMPLAVEQVWLYKDKATGKPKGDCTVTYEDPFSAASAVSWFNGKDFKGAAPSITALLIMQVWVRKPSLRYLLPKITTYLIMPHRQHHQGNAGGEEGGGLFTGVRPQLFEQLQVLSQLWNESLALDRAALWTTEVSLL